MGNKCKLKHRESAVLCMKLHGMDDCDIARILRMPEADVAPTFDRAGYKIAAHVFKEDAPKPIPRNLRRKSA